MVLQSDLQSETSKLKKDCTMRKIFQKSFSVENLRRLLLFHVLFKTKIRNYITLITVKQLLIFIIHQDGVFLFYYNYAGIRKEWKLPSNIIIDAILSELKFAANIFTIFSKASFVLRSKKQLSFYHIVFTEKIINVVVAVIFL